RRLNRVAVAVRVERGIAADHDVGVLVGLRDDRVEGAVHGVREDERAADHRDAEDDRKRAQRRAQLSSRQSLQCDLDHLAAMSSRTEMTSCASERPSSFTIRQSSRKRIRYAIGAARASWVTITVVCP